MMYAHEPGIVSAAEESTAWPGVSRPTYLGGLGFGFKWNMGWMHDTLGYFQQDPIYRRFHHHELTFSLMYAFSENFILPLSHDEVVHGKGSLLNKMPGDRWQKLANLRDAVRLHVGPPGQEAPVHGRRARPGVRVEPRALARLAPARGPAARRHPAAGARPQPPVPRRAGAVGDRLRPVGLLVDRAQRRRPQRRRVRPPVARGARGCVVFVANMSPGPAGELPGRAAALGPLARGAQHRLDVLRRRGHRQPRRRRGRADPVARPAGLRGADACRRWRRSGSCRSEARDRSDLAEPGKPDRVPAPSRYPLERPLGARPLPTAAPSSASGRRAPSARWSSSCAASARR